jgi:hypothetical protein
MNIHMQKTMFTVTMILLTAPGKRIETRIYRICRLLCFF